VVGGRLTVSVPRERVDDFLKSLTIVDTATSKPLPVSFPRSQSEAGPFIEMTLEVPQEAANVTLTYVTEAPAWKPSYRVVVGDHGKVMLEGWAIVDNTSGEDWKQVEVGVGSSSALSFRYDLWSVRSVQRETLATEERFAVAPPTAVSPYAQTPAGDVVAELEDDEIRRPPGHPEATAPRSMEDIAAAIDAGETLSGESIQIEGRAPVIDKGSVATGTSVVQRYPGRGRPQDARGGASAAPPAPQTRVAQGDQKVKSLAPKAVKDGAIVVVEGFADARRDGAEQRANDRANIVRNQLIDEGVPPAQIKVVTNVAAGERDRVRVRTEPAAPGAEKSAGGGAAKAAVDDTPVGESHFQSATPMTVRGGTSVMVSMVRSETDGEVVYLYDAESERGNDRFAFRAVRLKNPTSSTLETGPVTVYGQERFIGEGLTEPIPPGASVVVPFALDRQIVVESNQGSDQRLSQLVTLQRGVLTAEVQDIRRTQLTVTSRLRTPTTVFVRHTLRKGWALIDAPPSFERIGDAHLFELKLGAGETKTLTIAEATPVTRTLDLSSTVALDMMKVYVETAEGDAAFKRQLAGVLAIHREVVDGVERITSLRRRLGDYRQRMDELHGQLVTLQAVKTGGDLMRHLRGKMKEISDRVQTATIEIVDAEEKLMLARVRFQDGLAELRLPDAIAAAHATR